MGAPATSGSNPSRKAAVAMWRRRSAVVKFWRTALPASIVAILVTIIGWGIARGLMPGGERAPAEIADIEMVAGRFFGRDSNDRAFLVAFSRALQDARNDERYSLDNPTFNLGAGRASRTESGCPSRSRPWASERHWRSRGAESSRARRLAVRLSSARRR